MHYAEPYRVKIVQHNPLPPQHRRIEALRAAEYNVYRLSRRDVYLDFVATRGGEAMSDQQWSALMVGDEAYAGSRNFFELEATAARVLGKRWIVPTHAGRGAENLLLRHLMKPGQIVPTNKHVLTAGPLAQHQGGQLADVTVAAARDPRAALRTKGDVDLDALERLLTREAAQVAFVLLTCAVPVLGGQVLSLGSLQGASRLCRARGKRLVLDVSQVGSAAWLRREWENDQRPLGEIIRDYTAAADLLYMSARADAFCHTGGLICVDDAETLAALQALVVVFEGLHTYGGQAGRDMQAFARGLVELGDESYHFFRRRKFEHMEQRLARLEIPLYAPVGTAGPLIDARALLPAAAASSPAAGDPLLRAEALAATVYLASGVRLGPLGRLRQQDPDLDLLAMAVPRRTYTERQIDYAIDAVGVLRRLPVRPFRAVAGTAGVAAAPGRHELAALQPEGELGAPLNLPLPEYAGPEPYIVKVVEPMVMHDRAARRRAIEEAGFNTFLLRSEDCYIDLLTDSGTAAMSSRQWAGMLDTIEAESGSDGYDALCSAVHDVLGYRHVLPTHQGRAAEHLLSQCAIRPGQFVVNNMYFTTTREHQEMAGGTFVDLIVDPAHDPQSTYPWKGDIDPGKLEAFIADKGASAVAYICLETNVNMAGGQPVSMANSRRISAIARYHGIPVYFDATRIAENAWFIQKNEPGYQDRSIVEILRELCSYGDGCTVSAKKDLLVNIGGLLCINDDALHARVAALGGVYEGSPTQGGLAARDLMAMAIGCREMTDASYLRNRIEQVAYLGDRLRERGVPIVEPTGGHAVFLDARRFLDHLPQSQLPAQRLAAELYVESGVRAMERGVVSSGRDKVTGDHKFPKLELVRLTIPRRVYTYSHLDIVADGVAALHQRRRAITGLSFVYEPAQLRFFQARFAEL